MNPQPTIFLSSIISEFRDLRGALRYFLGKSGFRVIMSEEPDFGADCGIDSLDNCKNQIEKSDYYLLLIGNQPGSIFQLESKDTTVTSEEFKHFITLVRAGKSLNFIVFVRSQTWEYYTAKDLTNIHPLQYKLIDELINNSLFEDQKIGRWRYVFKDFADIITVLETNQNGLFLETTRKASLYRSYIKREIYDLFKSVVEKDREGGMIKSYPEVINLPEVKNLDYFTSSKIDHEIAIRIIGFLVVISSKETLLRKINRVFNYIAQGEYSQFDPTEEKYVLPEYIKLTIQTLEILERIFDNSKNIDMMEDIKKRDARNFYINKLEFQVVKGLYDDLNTVIAKLVNLTNFFAKNWNDFEKRPESFYLYGKAIGSFITDEEIISYADNYFQTPK